MADAFTIRLLPAVGLDGAFRVHLSVDSLESLKLTPGELCQISGDTTGYGIAWRATDRMGTSPKHRPAKISETLRAAFGFKEGSQVTISRTNAKIVHADKVTITDITPSDYGNAAEQEDGNWQNRIIGFLTDIEAFATGTTFDLTAKRRLKKRFYIDHIEAAETVGPALFYCDDRTRIVLCDGSRSPETIVPNGDALLPALLDTSRIGGLVEQVKELNRHLDYVLNKSYNTATRARNPHIGGHVLLHGYEGTGKTMILDRIRSTSSCKVFTVAEAEATAVKTISAIRSVFDDALAAERSIILVDELEGLAPKDNKSVTKAVANAFDRLKGSNVLVIAAVRSLTDIDGSFFKADRFEIQIELPIPDTEARRQILEVLLEQSHERQALAAAVSPKTHGFTGSDLALLYKKAMRKAVHRIDEHEDWVDVHARISMLNDGLSGQVDGSVHSQATTEVEAVTNQLAHAVIDVGSNDQVHVISPTLEDFASALETARPTALREVFLETPKVRWSDIGGSEAVKQRFDNTIGLPLHHADMVAAYGLKPAKGVLLYGPPGCSKTMTAQAVATMYDLNFIAVKGAELISMYVGESERAVREVFRKARQASPCVIFFDEIDSIGSERDASGTKGLNVLTTLLNEMDGFEAMHNVLVLAATNKPDMLDPALLRAGRFDSHVYVGLPSADARREILEISVRGIPSAIDVERLVVNTDGYSGAEIVGLCNAAKLRAVVRRIQGSQDDKVGDQDFEEAFGQIRTGVTSEMLKGYEAFATKSASG